MRKMFRVHNHNGTLIGEYETRLEAEADMDEYMYQTGNDAYIDEVEEA